MKESFINFSFEFHPIKNSNTMLISKNSLVQLDQILDENLMHINSLQTNPDADFLDHHI